MFKNEESLRYKLMRKDEKKLDIFSRIKEVRSLLSNTIGNISDYELRKALCHCWYYKFGRRKEINSLEHEILDILLKNNLSPKTCYHWFLLDKAPDHIKAKIKDKKISFRDALSSSSSWHKMTGRKGADKLMEDIRKIMGGLSWRSQEEK